MKLTRRQLPALLVSTAALAQAPAPPLPADAELQPARDQVKAIALALMQQQVPMSTEPAFVFQA
jgi:hypothetical protein